MGSRGDLRKARFYSVLCPEENHRAETGGGVAAAVGCSGGDGISRHEKKLSLLIAGKPSSLWQFAGLRLIGWDFWTSIPKGDMPRWTCVILEVWIAWAAAAACAHVAGSFLPAPETSDDAFDLRSRTGAHSQWLTHGRPFGRKRVAGRR